MEKRDLFEKILFDSSIFKTNKSTESFSIDLDSNFTYKKEVKKERNTLIDEFVDYSEQYYNAHIVLRDFFCDYYGNYSVSDQIPIPMMYFMRHGLELLLKANLYMMYEEKEAFKIMMNDKHSLKELFKHLDKDSFSDYGKMLKIMSEIDEFDFNSDLFRYPFSEKFLSIYRNKFLDVLKMSEVLLYCYEIVYEKVMEKRIMEVDDIDYCKKTYDSTEQFLIITNKRYGTCYLWQYKDVDSYKQVESYRNTTKILWYYMKNKNKKIELPLMFSMRHAVELLCKEVVNTIGWNYHIWINEQSNEKLKSGFIRGHNLKKILKQTNIVIRALENEDESIKESKKRFLHDIIKLGEIDKEGDYFRYPISSGGAMYKYDIDVERFVAIYGETLMFLDYLSNFADVISDYVDEMVKDYYGYY